MKRILLLVILITFTSTLHAQNQEVEDEFTMLTAYRDFFSQATDFSLSFTRYRPRGYDYRLRKLTLNKISMEDWENGTISWNILGNTSSRNLNADSDNILTISNDLKQGGKVDASFSNRSYRYKTHAGYNIVKGGSKILFDVSRRWGESMSIEGISADSYSLLLSGTQDFGKKHQIEYTLLFAPSSRTTQRASTAEAYSLLENNLYNAAWGWQSGSKRSTREQKAIQPIAIIGHNAKLSDKITLSSNLAARVGKESRTGLFWQNTPNPYPDYYRYMPSYQTDPDSQQTIGEAWINDPSVSQIDFQNLYNINGHNSPQAKYIIEQRWRDVQYYHLSSEIRGGTLNGGFEIVYGKNRNYKRIGDLFGADHWLDIDSFVEYDDDVKDQVQNNLRNPNFHAKTGDTFGYDYTMAMKRAKAWLSLEHRWGQFEAQLKGETSAIEYQREGHFEKENFDGSESYGKSPQIRNYDYDINAEGWYNQGGKLRAGVAINYRSMGQNPSQLFMSREYRNATVSESVSEKIAAVEMSIDYRSAGFKAKGAIYYTAINDRTQLMSFYDDNVYQYTHYWMRGVGQRHMGVEISTEFGIAENLSGSIAAALSDNRYTTNPTATQWRETTGEELRTDEKVYYENLHISGSPQNVAVAALNYTPKQYRFSLTANYFDNNYISITPLRRTDRSAGRMTKTTQEKLTSGATLDIFGGRMFYFQNGQSIGLWMGVNNLMNNRNIRTGGYESFRTVDTAASDSRYYYALGINGFISLSFNF